MNSLINKFECNGYVVEIHNDCDAESPCDVYDNMTTIAHWHSRYVLGNKRIERMNEAELRECEPDILVLKPLYLYDHSGLAVSTSPFSCQWDSGQVGWVYITKDDAIKMGVETWDKDRLTKALDGEVKTYADYLSGNVYGYVIRDGDEEVDSSWGIYGSDTVEEDARVTAEHRSPGSLLAGKLEMFAVTLGNKNLFGIGTCEDNIVAYAETAELGKAVIELLNQRPSLR